MSRMHDGRGLSDLPNHICREDGVLQSGSLFKTVKIMDSNFRHAGYTTDIQVSQHVRWDWVSGSYLRAADKVFVTDNCLVASKKIKARKVGFLLEPRAINPSIYEWVRKHHRHFETILTYDKELLEAIDNALFYPIGGCWIKPEDFRVYPKSHLLSIIASAKDITEGHKLRHAAVSRARGINPGLAVFGREYNPVDYKLEALKDYAFSIVIENSRADYYFTEKLIDAFVTGTVPVYWGCPSIGDFFDPDGMLVFDDMADLARQLQGLSMQKYQAMLPAIQRNFEIAKNYCIAEEWLFNNTRVFDDGESLRSCRRI